MSFEHIVAQNLSSKVTLRIINIHLDVNVDTKNVTKDRNIFKLFYMCIADINDEYFAFDCISFSSFAFFVLYLRATEYNDNYITVSKL